MYPYNYNMPGMYGNMYRRNQNNDRLFLGGGFFAPLLLGGVAGYALGANQPNYYPRPYYYPRYYNNYNNYYYNPYYY